MSPIIFQALEELMYRKIMHYNDLLRVLNRERESLTNIDLESLWELSREKEEICSRIEDVRRDIFSAMDQAGEGESFSLSKISSLVAPQDRLKFNELNRTLMRLRGEVDMMRKENISFIDDSLTFLDEMISVIAGTQSSELTYNKACHLSGTGVNALLNREV